ncbi:MAG: hypothetical protein V1873_05250, partial [Verrucomicrobiota bacterium]
EFFNPLGGTSSVSVVTTAKLTNGTPADTWIKVSVTNRAPWVGAWVTGRVSCAILDPVKTPYGGTVYFDSVMVTETNIPASNSQSGSLWNPGFEYTADGTKLPFIDSWTNLGLAGNVDSSFKRTGNNALKIFYTETLLAQLWPATQGWRYASSAYAFTVSDPEGTNLLTNPGLTGSGTAPAGWSDWGVDFHDPDTSHYRSSPNSWQFWWGAGLFQDVTSGFSVGETVQFGGWFYMTTVDALRGGDKYGVIQVEFYDSTNGFISSASASPTIKSNSVRDTWFATQGSAVVPAGAAKIRTLVRCNVPTSGDGIFSADDIYLRKAPATPNRFASATNAHAVLLLQYTDATGTNVLTTYESAWFTTNNPADTWTNLLASGVAPSGTKYGRTMLGILGTNTGFGGAVWFDDAVQWVASTGTTSGLLHNPGFEDGPSGNAYNLWITNDLPYWTWLGGTNGGFITTTYMQEGAQSLSITFPNNLAGQRVNATTGRTYVVSGYMSSPVSEKLTNGAYGVFYLEFYNSSFKSGTSLVSVVESAHFTSNNTPGTWYSFAVTNRAPWTGGAVTARVLCAVAGSTQNYGGAVYFDGLSMTESYVGLTNTQSGALWNPGFEYTAEGTVLEQVDNWTALGNAGLISATYKRSGRNALRFYGPETLAAQTWAATQGWKYASSGYVFTPSAERLQGVTNLHAVVLLQFLNATNGVLLTYESPWFTTNNAADAWTNLTVTGVAPAGTVWGRTLPALLGTNIGFGGSVYFDDLSQSVVATGVSTNGLLRNPGFDDGPPGNAYDLARTNDLPAWKWNGGTNAGFIARDYKKDAEQALVITYPRNGAGQDWAAASGKSYKAEGYLFTPSNAQFRTDGSSWGQLEMTFYVNGDTNPVTENTAISAPFGGNQASNGWMYFAVTGTAPSVGIVTGRLTCTIVSADPQQDFELGGVIYFDQLSVVQFTTQTSAWEQWQMQNFGTNSGPGVGYYDDYDLDRYLNWYEFIADTQPTNNKSLLAAAGSRASAGNFIVTWPSASGRYYTLLRLTNLMNGAVTSLTNNFAATPPQNTYTDAVPSSVERYYYRVSVTTNHP